MEVKNDEFGDNKTYRGYIIDLLDEVKKKANFEYKIEISPDGTFGRELTPGNWSGTINEVIQKVINKYIGSKHQKKYLFRHIEFDSRGRMSRTSLLC